MAGRHVWVTSSIMMCVMVTPALVSTLQGRMQEFSRGGAKKYLGQITRTTSAPPGALSVQNLPHLGHFHHKICHTWGTFSVKCALPGALYAIWRGILGQGAGQTPPLPRPCIRPCNDTIIGTLHGHRQAVCNYCRVYIKVIMKMR